MKGSDPYGSFQNQCVTNLYSLRGVNSPKGWKDFSGSRACNVHTKQESGTGKDTEMYPSLQISYPMLFPDLFRSVSEQSIADTLIPEQMLLVEAAKELGCAQQLS